LKTIAAPKVYLVAKTTLAAGGLQAYLNDIGSPEWDPDPQISDGENLIEAAGRMCYRSWQPYDRALPDATNPNVTRIRQGNKKYIGHVLEAGAYFEGVQRELARIFDIERVNNFSLKKSLTSMFRRLLPIGVATTIMVTGSLRAWRHIIEMRTAEGAEEEIRLVLDQIARICQREFPHVFQDMSYREDTGEWVFEYSKV